LSRAKIRLHLGRYPDKCDTNGKVVESVRFKDYIREKVSYFVERDESVYAYVLRPIDDGIYPAILCHHQHQEERKFGKDEPAGIQGDKTMNYAEELAKIGYITFVPDSLAYGERRDKEDPVGFNYWVFATRLVQGKTLLAKNLHDLSQGIDYLETRSDVDKTRIGFIGHSFGGRIGLWAASLDKRIKATVCHCGCISYKESMTRDTGIQLEFAIHGIASELDIEDVIKLIEPNNLLLSTTSCDKWSRGAKSTFQKAKPFFDVGNLEFILSEGGHEFSEEMRLNAYAFLNRFLK